MLFGSGTERRLDALAEQVDTLASGLERIDAALVVRDPGNARSADAYDGLRRQVAAAAGERRRLLVQLARLGAAVDHGASVDDVRSLAEEWAAEAGLVRWTDTTRADAFTLLGEGDGPVELLQPAWIDTATDSVVREGRAQRLPSPAQVPAEPRPERAAIAELAADDAGARA
ncbi:MAG: hypothetical protein LC789_11195 [Actinobacteria bacterium]|nr:hypothetical protein [Actinomycetota bacterium]